MSQYGSQSNPYYGGTGGGGGGYMAGGSPYGSNSGSPGGVKRSEASQSLRPVTIAQLQKATQAHTDAEWHVDNSEIGSITVVAQVVHIQSQATNSVYELDDGTGQMEARVWIDSSNEGEDKNTDLKTNTYVRVTGTLKVFGSKRYINATHIRHCPDPHEPYFHILEAISVNVILERGPPPAPGQAPRAAPVPGISAYANQGQATAPDQFAHLPDLQRRIANYILSVGPTDDGVHVAAIARNVGGEANLINDALDTLMDGGYVYSTVDDSHFSVSA